MLNSLGESCYEGVRLLVQLVRRAGSLDLDWICAVADTVGYDGSPGAVQLRAASPGAAGLPGPGGQPDRGPGPAHPDQGLTAAPLREVNTFCRKYFLQG